VRKAKLLEFWKQCQCQDHFALVETCLVARHETELLRSLQLITRRRHLYVSQLFTVRKWSPWHWIQRVPVHGHVEEYEIPQASWPGFEKRDVFEVSRQRDGEAFQCCREVSRGHLYSAICSSVSEQRKCNGMHAFSTLSIILAKIQDSPAAGTPQSGCPCRQADSTSVTLGRRRPLTCDSKEPYGNSLAILCSTANV
jgi:hypothetical protein